MAFWNYKDEKIHHAPAKEVRNGWLEIDCGCSVGLEWGGEYPRECRRCDGRGYISYHVKSGTFAEYPGGRLKGRGKLTKLEIHGGQY